MKVERLIKELTQFAEKHPGSEVKLHGPEGLNVVFVLGIANKPEYEKVIWLESSLDCDMKEELNVRFTHAVDNDCDELDFFMDLLESGITIDDIKQYAPDRYEYAKNFMKEHGLI